MEVEKEEDQIPSHNSEESGQRRIDDGDESPDVYVEVEEVEITIDPEGIDREELETIRFEEGLDNLGKNFVPQEVMDDSKRDTSPVRLVNDTNKQAEKTLRISSPELNAPLEDDDRPTLIPPPSQIPVTEMEDPDPEAETKPYPPELLHVPGFLKSDLYKLYEAANVAHLKKIREWSKREVPEGETRGEMPKQPHFQKYFDTYLERIRKKEE